MVKLAIVDDHTLFRIGLIAILKSEPTFTIVGEFDSFTSIRPLISTLNAEIILLDISLEDESGFEVAKHIKKERPSVKIIILSSHKEEFHVVNAMDAGVDGYMHKNSKPDELILGIKKVAKGQKFFSSEISSLLINSIYTKPYRGLPFLTSKEKEIIQHLIDGSSSKEIATKLNVSPRTIETHRSNILGKFGMKNTTELIKNIVEQKIRF